MNKKSIIHSALILVCFLLANCSGAQQETLSDLFTKAPAALFDYTTEGISSDEMNDLITKGESASWEITHKSDEKIEIDCKYPSSTVTLSLLERKDNSPILVSFTQNEQVTSFVTWEAKKDGHLEKVNLLPVVHATEFFSASNQFDNISDYDGNISYYMDTNTMMIKASIYTWMEKDFENRTIDFDIVLKWNGTTFDIEKNKLSN